MVEGAKKGKFHSITQIWPFAILRSLVTFLRTERDLPKNYPAWYDTPVMAFNPLTLGPHRTAS